MATVLYVDDESAIRRAIRSWLVRRGHQVFTAGSAAEAVALLETESVDGAFIDIWLGADSGFDLYETISMRWPAIARNTTFVTGDVIRDPDVDRSLAIIQRPVLAKPFELGELERTILSWVPG